MSLDWLFTLWSEQNVVIVVVECHAFYFEWIKQIVSCLYIANCEKKDRDKSFALVLMKLRSWETIRISNECEQCDKQFDILPLTVNQYTHEYHVLKRHLSLSISFIGRWFECYENAWTVRVERNACVYLISCRLAKRDAFTLFTSGSSSYY